MLSTLILLFVAVPIIELYILIEVGQFIGAGYTILLVISTGIVGAILAKFEGLRVWHGLQKDLMSLKMPTNRIVDGVLILIGGVLLLTPGIITDIIGFLLIIPFTRPIIREPLKKHFAKKTKQGVKDRIKVIDV
ncbi:MAG: membrane protein FxsA [Parcubacteria group bacterium]|nr:membrane protein FxsA [Parcubacteria group bacterium]|tara:strand:+ start:1224 stop:1625 length:402 start_codon:yes stop_codon:yes gene_type:complete